VRQIAGELDLRLLRHFVAVAEELHFTRAAARLYVAQQALSRDIRRLEQQLGVRLLTRTTRQVRLTADGERLLVRARELLALATRTGLHVIAATGFHRDAHYPAGHWVLTEPEDSLAELLAADLTVGMDERDWQGPRPRPGPARVGVIKLGASYQTLTLAERRRLAAGARAAVRTGAPVAVHCEQHVGVGQRDPQPADDLLDGRPRGGVTRPARPGTRPRPWPARHGGRGRPRG
jgi:Bacterial regulatory helix-turn-helix protein, lysR family/Phosphotriesterase family